MMRMHINKIFIRRLSMVVLISIGISFISSCENKKTDSGKINKAIKENQEVKSSRSENDSLYLTKKLEQKNEPCKNFQEFVNKIKKDAWIPDDKRLRKVSAYNDLKNAEIHYFNGNPFYKIEFDKSHFKKMTETFKKIKASDYSAVKDVNSIWSYFYREEQNANFITDGVIEQWTFSNDTKAREAIKQMIKMSDLTYFNTTPYFCKIENKVFVFHTRASGFSVAQKSVYKKFIADNTSTCEVFDIKPELNKKHRND